VDVLVTGGTGALGRQVVRQLRERGHRAVILSRKQGEGEDWRRGDLATGEGIAAAVAGVEAIVHAGSATVQPHRYRVTDVDGTRRLLQLAKDAGVAHLVYVSIVGMEGVKYPYYRWKLAAEKVVEAGPLPWSTLRATQFHTLMEIFLGGMAFVPGLLTVPYRWRFQPVDTRDVATRLVEVVESGPAGLLPDFGGPEVRDFKSIAESWLSARKQRRRLLNLPLPLQFSRKFAEGSLLCPDHRDGQITWEQYLGRRYDNPQKTVQQA
jgi:uncharacterized protein YbjT (DUF2867 family)